MNGIIHNCSHPNDDNDLNFRLTEEQIFVAIFDYIDHLFMKIKPKRLFYLAVDGVAPRAKMNQQRSRRFRTAQEANMRRIKAKLLGQELIDDEPFDSNCITPGTLFMKRLSKHLEYYVRKRISEDPQWKGVEVILSGHEVPGEGEHKIMEYIRSAKSQSDYDPNTRHCLYGLDADLIMLGLLTHEPHFSLLREEITFGPKRSAPKRLDRQSFYLMHLSLFRQYLALEFKELDGQMQIPYNVVNIIDDFVLISLFVGNDFLPNLPNLHISGGALSMMFKMYKKVMMNATDYMNKDGRIHLPTLFALLKELEVEERKHFRKVVNGDSESESQMSDSDTDVEMLPSKVSNQNMNPGPKPHSGKQSDPSYIADLDSFLVSKAMATTIQANENDSLVRLCSKLKLGCSRVSSDQWHIARGDMEDTSDDEIDEYRFSVLRNPRKRVETPSPKLVDSEQYIEWKRDYYKFKLEIDVEKNPGGLKELLHEYIRGLHWVLRYYYDGVASWGWFFPYHYGPHVSDLGTVVMDEINLEFEMGKPFLPFEQLLGVLPAASKQHIPEPLHWLMTSPTSPIFDFYPEDIEIDLNGKKNDWEAVVKVPFIDQSKLLLAIRSREHLLSEEEKQRNKHGKAHIFVHSEKQYSYPSSFKGVFPDLANCNCQQIEFSHQRVTEFVRGLLPGTVEAAGFPTFNEIPYHSTIGVHGVKVFQMPSTKETIVIHVNKEQCRIDLLSKRLMGKHVHVNWPFLIEGKVEEISDGGVRYLNGNPGSCPLNDMERSEFLKAADNVVHWYSSRFAVELHPVEVMVGVRTIKEMVRLLDGSVCRQYSDSLTWCPLQLVVETVNFVDERFQEKPPRPFHLEYQVGLHIFSLDQQTFGFPGHVSSSNSRAKTVSCELSLPPSGFPVGLGSRVLSQFKDAHTYHPSFVACKKLSISSLALSKLSSSLLVIVTTDPKDQNRKWNVGLQMKFEGKGHKVVGYTRKTNAGWQYSDAAITLLQGFCQEFPTFVARLQHKSTSTSFYSDIDFFPASTAYIELLKIKDWIQNSPVSKFEKVDVSNESLMMEEVRALETALSSSSLNGKRRNVRSNDMPAHKVLKPEYAEMVLRDQSFSLGDCVIVVSDSGKCPLGSVGFVVGIDQNQIEVILQSPFMGGSTLQGR
jgi:5'-3' exoribonuclease 1